VRQECEIDNSNLALQPRDVDPAHLPSVRYDYVVSGPGIILCVMVLLRSELERFEVGPGLRDEEPRDHDGAFVEGL
jgi:hypothetical protein